MVKINSQFEAGAIELVEASNARSIKVNIAKDNNSCTRQWFYFSVTTEVPEKHKIQVINADQVSFANAWQGYQVFASNDNNNWFRVATELDGSQLIIQHDAQASTVFYAYFVPYSLARQDQLLQSIKQHPQVKVESLTRSALDHSIDLIHIGQPAAHKKNIWLIARQHSGESMAQWIAEGFLKALTEENNTTTTLLANYHFFIVANMNPDGVQVGNHRTNANGNNLNRCWAQPSPDSCPEVYYVKKAMVQYGVDLFFDIHGDEALPYNFMMARDKGEFGARYKQKLAELERNFQIEFDYDSDKSSCGTSCCNTSCSLTKTATGFVAANFNASSLLVEASFKNLQNANAAENWDQQTCIEFGKNLLLTLSHVLH